MRAAVLTISTSRSGGASGGSAPSDSGPRLAEFARSLGAEVAAEEFVPDDAEQIAARLAHWCDAERVELLLTTGGTGVAPSDVTPEATLSVAERLVPGIAEAMRLASRPHTSNWMLSRGVAGIRGRTLIVNFPGSPKAIGEVTDELAEALGHALALLRGERPH